MSKLDTIYRSLLHTKFFVKGWGKPDNLKKIMNFRKKMSDRNTCKNLVSKDYPVHITKEREFSNYKLLEGYFITPAYHYVPEVIPKEIINAKFQIILPKNWNSELRPICLHLAGTGDHGFRRRQILMGQPLLKENIASIILENPFYGLRKPPAQRRSCLHNVSDLFVMGACLILESLVLFHWSEREGYGPLGITGISMGGHMASIAGSNWHKPLAIVPCLSWTTASCAFTQGVLSGAIPWNVLEAQYVSDKVYQTEIKKLLSSPEENAEDFYSDNLLRQTFSDSIFKLSKNFLKSKETTDNETFGDQMSVRKEALKFMREIMDECTHIGNFSVPVDPSLCLVVAAKGDRYIPRDGLKQITDYWPGAEVRYIDKGHVAAVLFHRSSFRKAIVDAFNKMISKYQLRS